MCTMIPGQPGLHNEILPLEKKKEGGVFHLLILPAESAFFPAFFFFHLLTL